MLICAMSDLHGQLPANLPAADVYIIAGDLCPGRQPWLQTAWLQSHFEPWCDKLDCPVMVTAGNHDAVFEGPRPAQASYSLLLDEALQFNDLTFYGSPWTKTFFNWFFMKDEPDLEQHFALLPPADVYIMHSPPYGYGDFSPYNHVHTGSPTLLQRIEEHQPKLVVWGHIHSGRGIWQVGPVTMANVSMVDEQYRPVHEAMLFEV